jgi:hypothetical protein
MGTKANVKRAIVTLAVSLITLTLSSAAYAGYDGKTYGGGHCQSREGNSVLYTWGRVSNTSPSTQWFDCPVVKDMGHLHSAWMYVIDQNNREDFACRAGTISGRNVNSGFMTPMDYSEGDSTRPQLLTMNGVSSVFKGYNFLSCRVPGRDADDNKRSEIVAYDVRDHD